MKKKSRAVIVALFTLCLMRCSEEFERPSVISIMPGNNTMAVDRSSAIVVDFSSSMDVMKTANEFSLSSKSGITDGLFSWENGNSRLKFSPSEPLREAETYTLRITKSAEDSRGNDLKDDFFSVFYTGDDIRHPGLESFTPASGTTGNSPDTAVVLNFSERMDINSIYRGINISPSVQGRFIQDSAQRSFKFIPVYGFDNGVTYTVSIPDTVCNVSGSRIIRPVSFSFTVGNDFTNPELSAYQENSTRLVLDENIINYGAEKDGRIIMDFSEEVKTNNIAECILISPFVEFYVSSENVNTSGIAHTRGIINFLSNLDSETTYTLKISNGIMDLHDNLLLKEYRFLFVTDAAKSVAPVINRIGDYNEGFYRQWRMDSIEVLGPPAGMYFKEIAVDFVREMDPLSLTMTADYVLGSGSGGITIVNIDWPGQSVQAFTQLRFGLYNVAAGNTYRIKIKGGDDGIKDVNGNYMKEDFVQMIKF